MQESGRTQDFVSTGFPPVTHKTSTACSAARRKEPAGRSKSDFFKPLDSGFGARNSGAMNDAGKPPVVSYTRTERSESNDCCALRAVGSAESSASRVRPEFRHRDP